MSCESGAAKYAGGFKPIYPTCKDVNVISDDLVEQIISHNKYGAKEYGWKSTRRGNCSDQASK